MLLIELLLFAQRVMKNPFCNELFISQINSQPNYNVIYFTKLGRTSRKQLAKLCLCN